MWFGDVVGDVVGSVRQCIYVMLLLFTLPCCIVLFISLHVDTYNGILYVVTVSLKTSRYVYMMISLVQGLSYMIRSDVQVKSVLFLKY